MFRNLAISLFENEMIKTTLARAKELRRVVEPLITLSKLDSVARRRQAFSTLRNKDSVKKLFDFVFAWKLCLFLFGYFLVVELFRDTDACYI